LRYDVKFSLISYPAIKEILYKSTMCLIEPSAWIAMAVKYKMALYIIIKYYFIKFENCKKSFLMNITLNFIIIFIHIVFLRFKSTFYLLFIESQNVFLIKLMRKQEEISFSVLFTSIIFTLNINRPFGAYSVIPRLMLSVSN